MKRMPGTHPGVVPPASGSALLPAALDQALQTPGHALDATVRAEMEARLDRDLSGVRVHSDGAAAESARALGANAYAVGQHLVFGAGAYAPRTPTGRALLAHELSHTLQPVSGPVPLVAPAGAASECEARRIGETVQGHRGAPTAQAGGLVQRDPLPGVAPLPPLRGGDALLDHATPLLAAAIGSVTLENFDTGKAELKPEHASQLAATARSIKLLLDQYPLSTIRIIGHADTVGEEADNLALGQARAAATRRALVDLGVAEHLVEVSSKGEAAPQAVQTRNETANAHNRRVEVRFDPKKDRFPGVLGGALRKPELSGPASGGPGQTPDIPSPFKPIGPKGTVTLPPEVEGPREGNALPKDFWKPIPPLPKGPARGSLIDAIGDRILDPVIDKVLGGLPGKVRDKVKEAARAGVAAGISKGVRAAAEANGVTDSEALDAIENATEAAIKAKAQGTQP